MKDIFTKTPINNRIIWIVLAFFGWYLILDDIVSSIAMKGVHMILPPVSNAMTFVLTYYTPLIFSVLFFLLVCLFQLSVF